MNQEQLAQAWVKENGNLVEYAGELSKAALELEKKFNDPSIPPRAMAFLLLVTLNQMLPQMFDDEPKARTAALCRELDWFVQSLKTKEFQ
jgi:hypothetical protein